jgi:lipoyl(octanoyl) transferase
VYTIGKSGNRNHLLASEEELRSKDAEVYYIDRGGDVTYHGPGQLVGYPILDLNTYYLDIHRYLRDLEEVIIRTLGEFGIKANRDSNFTGVWVGSEKIAAIGVKVSRWVTMHGFALNVNTDLSYFDRIIPCGIFHKGVTSIEKLLGQQVPLDEVSQCIVKHFEEVFDVKSIEQNTEQIAALLNENIECLQ